MKKLLKRWKLKFLLKKSNPDKKITIIDNEDGSQIIIII